MIDADKFLDLISHEICFITPEEAKDIKSFVISDKLSDYEMFLEHYIYIKTYAYYSIIVSSDFFNNNDKIFNTYTLNAYLSFYVANKAESKLNFFDLFKCNISESSIFKHIQDYDENGWGFFTIEINFRDKLTEDFCQKLNCPHLHTFLDKTYQNAVKRIQSIINFRTAEKAETFSAWIKNFLNK